ncbi:MAG: sulfatase-like hydrolase/transferase, partial [Acidobacteria bacterium]|nr:sulfatase-like hydrolase/transferase [Acidobacteriota bacterium]
LGERGSYAIIGPHFARAAASPLAYYKFHGGEGGIRVPLIVAGPGVEARGIAPAFAYATDIVPTLLELTGTSDATPSGKHPVSGRSLAPALRNLGVDIHPQQAAIGFETAGHAGVFKGNYKLVRVVAPDGDSQWRLFDLAEDPGETRDLAVEEPQRLAEMLADYEAYAARVGVLEVPASYSPTRQLLINYLYDRARANLHLVVAGAGLGVVLVGLLVWLIRRLRAATYMVRPAFATVDSGREQVGSVADIYPASGWEHATPGPRWVPPTPALTRARPRGPLWRTGSVGVSVRPFLPSLPVSHRATADDRQRPSEQTIPLFAGPVMAVSLLTAVATLFAAGGDVSPEGPERSGGAA